MNFWSYLSFASLYEIEQREKERSLTAADLRGVLRRDSGSSNSSASSSSFSRVNFPAGDRTNSNDTLSSASSASDSIYALHSARRHSSSKRYSTSDGSLPNLFCPYGRCSSVKTCTNCKDNIEEQDLSLRRFSR